MSNIKVSASSDSLSIVLPTFNEVKSLEFVISKWHQYLTQRNIIHEFVVCEDGSTDGTKELIKNLMNNYPIINESTLDRRGYGGGVTSGIKVSNNDYILCIDSDGQCLPDSFDSLWKQKEESDIVIGIRYPRNDPFIRIVYSHLFLAFHKILFPSKIKDPSCPYILAKKEIFINLVPYLHFMREGFWWGFIGAALRHNLVIDQAKIKHYKRYDGSSVVYGMTKMPAIIIRNIFGLIKLRLAKI